MLRYQSILHIAAAGFDPLILVLQVGLTSFPPWLHLVQIFLHPSIRKRAACGVSGVESDFGEVHKMRKTKNRHRSMSRRLDTVLSRRFHYRWLSSGWRPLLICKCLRNKV